MFNVPGKKYPWILGDWKVEKVEGHEQTVWMHLVVPEANSPGDTDPPVVLDVLAYTSGKSAVFKKTSEVYLPLTIVRNFVDPEKWDPIYVWKWSIWTNHQGLHSIKIFDNSKKSPKRRPLFLKVNQPRGQGPTSTLVLGPFFMPRLHLLKLKIYCYGHTAQQTPRFLRLRGDNRTSRGVLGFLVGKIGESFCNQTLSSPENSWRYISSSF